MPETRSRKSESTFPNKWKSKDFPCRKFAARVVNKCERKGMRWWGDGWVEKQNMREVIKYLDDRYRRTKIREVRRAGFELD